MQITQITLNDLRKKAAELKTFIDSMTAHFQYGVPGTISKAHVETAVKWPDGMDCLLWACENAATVAEMKAWRRAVHGEDLTLDPKD